MEQGTKLKNVMVGKNIYSELKKNTRVVWGVVLISLVSILSMLFLAYSIYQESNNKLYTINNKGDLIPLSLISSRADKEKIIKSNADYFVKNFYDLDQYSLKEKKEKLLWLVGEQPTKIIKDKDAKGYFSTFLTVNGLIQKAEILPDSWSITNLDDNPEVSFRVLVKRVNSNAEEFFNADVKLRMTKVNINYPYNPFGYLITDFVESLSRIQKPTDEEVQKIDSIKIEQANPSIK